MACKGCMKCHQNIAGAGVLILTDSKLFFGEYDVILVKDHSGEYNDAGGKSEGFCAHYTASRELLEETRGTVNVSSDDLRFGKYVEIGDSLKHLYRCYIVYLPNVHCSDYYEIDATQLSYAYRETTGMTRFPFKNVEDAIKVNSNYVFDDRGNERKLNKRVKSAIKEMFRQHF